MIEPSAARIPWMFATGNHDSELFSAQVAADAGDRRATTSRSATAGWRSGWTCRRPGRPPARRSTASATATSGSSAWTPTSCAGRSRACSATAAAPRSAWLRGQLAAWRSDAAVDFIVAFFHECAFSTCNGHSSDGGVRSALAPLFARYQVDLAVQGHNHVYERTNPLLYDAGDQQRPLEQAGGGRLPDEPAEVEPARDGTTYVVVGHRGHAPLRLDRGA